MSDAERFFKLCINETYRKECRKTAITNNIGKIVIDTIYAPDRQKWETGINKTGNITDWIIVELYKDKKTAKIGHKKWVDKIKKNPKLELEAGKGCSAEEWIGISNIMYSHSFKAESGKHEAI